MKFKVSTLVKALACATVFAGAAAAQSNCCWFDKIPAPGVKLFPAGPPKTYVFVTAPVTAPGGTWTANNYYFLCRDIDVMANATLTVQPGTWIFAGPWQYDGTTGGWCYAWGSSLIIQRGAKAIMKGKADSIIVMTGIGDDPRDIATLGPGAKGLFGGLVVLGRAPVSNYKGEPGLYAEGLAWYRDSSNGRYGGTDSEDSSGVYEYLSVRHGGCGKVSASEVNGITLCGVGSRTVLNHLEVMSNFDDGIELFGGSCNMDHIVISFVDDDGLDLDAGYNGKIQFAFIINQGWAGNRNCEWDGKLPGDSVHKSPSNPTIANVTIIGSGKCSQNNATDNHDFSNEHLICVSDSLKGTYRNIIVGDGPSKVFRFYKHQIAWAYPFGPNFDWQGVIAFNMGGGTSWAQLVRADSLIGKNVGGPIDAAEEATRVAYLTTPANKCNITDPRLRGISREFGFAALDPRPCLGSVALDPNYYAPTPAGLVTANYVGAFDAVDLWCDGWTKLSHADVLAKKLTVSPIKEIVCANCCFDVCVQIGEANPNVSLTGLAFTLDNIDVTTPFVDLIVGGGLGGGFGAYPCGGTYLHTGCITADWITGISCNNTERIPAINYDGLHVIKTTVTMSDSKTYTAYSKIKISK